MFIFRNVLSIDDYASCFENIDPLAPYKKWTTRLTCHDSTTKEVPPKINVHSQRVQAAFVVSDSVDWSRDIQVIANICTIWTSYHLNLADSSIYCNWSEIFLMACQDSLVKPLRLAVQKQFFFSSVKHETVSFPELFIFCIPKFLSIRISKIYILLVIEASEWTVWLIMMLVLGAMWHLQNWRSSWSECWPPTPTLFCTWWPCVPGWFWLIFFSLYVDYIWC